MGVKSIKILVLNNYSITRVMQEIEDGLKPSHHLYGITDLKQAGCELIIIDPVQNTFWERVSFFFNKFLFWDLGDISLQVKAFKRRREYDEIYAPCQTVTLLLGFLSYLGLFNKKIVAVAHHPFLVGRMAFLRKFFIRFSLKGHHKWGSLTKEVAIEINQICKRDLAVYMHWGPDIEYYKKVSESYTPIPMYEKPVDLVAIGRTGRDYQVLIDAFANTAVIVEVYCSREHIATLSIGHAPNIRLVGLQEAEGLKYPEILQIYQRSKIMAIPMYHQKTLAGLTSITDAIALGMPVVSTKNHLIELDIEKEGAGFWVEPGDSEAWKQIVLKMLKDNNLQEFSKASKELGENEYNSQIFFRELTTLFLT